MYKRDYLHASKDILLCYVLHGGETLNIRLFYTTFALTIPKRSRFEPTPPPLPQSLIWSYAPEQPPQVFYEKKCS